MKEPVEKDPSVAGGRVQHANDVRVILEQHVSAVVVSVQVRPDGGRSLMMKAASSTLPSWSAHTMGDTWVLDVNLAELQRPRLAGKFGDRQFELTYAV